MNKFNMTIYDLAEEFSYSLKKDFDVLENSKMMIIFFQL